jgi:hypothetical protein
LAQSVNTNVGGWDNGVSITPAVSTTAYSASQAAGANLQAENDNDWPAFANDNLPLIVKIASGEWR